MHTEL